MKSGEGIIAVKTPQEIGVLSDKIKAYGSKKTVHPGHKKREKDLEPGKGRKI
jgi:hypothetical protein